VTRPRYFHTYIEELAEQIYKKIESYGKLMDSIFSLVKKSLESKEIS